ncbi:STAS domain-containing protein [Geodermatophilus pulveris]|uniref:STAS domain-containing protein n=1 Tax=Geodermatophilus pulveris TaxID=1564159 RepID=A0A239JBK5_9ACTN|nr:STAS domain-containing protein [Geodermatophilus pulveris]SNT03230.1 STAS domain-containing protein [Geodermatophilus pulveris]
MRRTDLVVRPDGVLAASGYLTCQGADLVRGTAASLRSGGCTRVVVDLRGVRAADAAGLAVLQQLRRELAADGCELVVRGAPTRAEGVGFEPTMGVTP